MNIKVQIRAVIFDVDGTLFDTLPSLSAAANSALVQAGLSVVEAAHMRIALNEGLKPMFRKSIAMQTAPVDPAMAIELENEFLNTYTSQWLPKAPLYAGVQEALMALKSQGLKLGICTNRDRASTGVLLAQAGISGMFDTIVGMGDGARPKPAADPLQMILERMEIPAAEALFVGDSGLDATCAELSQVRFAAHLGGYAEHPGDLLPNALSFSTYDQLRDWVLSHLNITKEACNA
jgi:phosphoglycolate phosphatase